MQGGAITLVDIPMGAAVFAGGADDERPVTIEMKFNYLDPGEAGVLQPWRQCVGGATASRSSRLT